MFDAAKNRFDELKQLYEKANRQRHPRKSTHTAPIDDLCEEAISLARNWVEWYKPHIQKLNPADPIENNNWVPTTEGIRDTLCQFKRLLSSQQTDHPLLETVDKIREEVEELLKKLYP